MRPFRLHLVLLLPEILALRYKHLQQGKETGLDMSATGKVVRAPWGISLGYWVMFL